MIRRLVALIAFASLTGGAALVNGQRPEEANAGAAGDRRDREVVRITTLKEDGGRVDWSHRNNLIAFDRLGKDDFLDVYTMRPDGSDERCLTCNKPGAPAKHMGNPAWHPSGEYIVFQAQNTFRGLGKITDYFANSGAGVNNDLWVMDANGTKFWPLTKLEPRVGGVLHPHFSHDGRRLFWAQKIAIGGGKYGTWTLRVADFSFVDGTPRLTNERVMQPGHQKKMYESDEFTQDGRQILFSGNLERGQAEKNADIYLMDLESQRLTNLTNSQDQGDEHAHISPDGRTIVWTTSSGQREKLNEMHPVIDFWMMNIDGSNKRRLTYFNEPGQPEYIKGGVAPADNSWGPDGRIVAYVLTNVKRGGKIVDDRARQASVTRQRVPLSTSTGCAMH